MTKGEFIESLSSLEDDDEIEFKTLDDCADWVDVNVTNVSSKSDSIIIYLN